LFLADTKNCGKVTAVSNNLPYSNNVHVILTKCVKHTTLKNKSQVKRGQP
jgi:hypothetical protein